MNAGSKTRTVRVIEFFGVPGSGKSYLATRACVGPDSTLTQSFRRGPKVVRVSRKLLLVLSSLWQSDIGPICMWRFVVAHGPEGWMRRSRVWFNWLFVESLIRGGIQAGKKTIVLEQGVAQALWSTTFMSESEPPNEEMCEAMTRWVKTNRISEWTVFHVTAPDATVRNRLRRRKGLSPLDKEPQLLIQAKEAERRVEAVLVRLHEGSGGNRQPRVSLVPVVNVGDEAVERVAQHVSNSHED